MSLDVFSLVELQNGAGRAARPGRPIRGRVAVNAIEILDLSPTGPVGATKSMEAIKVP